MLRSGGCSERVHRAYKRRAAYTAIAAGRRVWHPALFRAKERHRLSGTVKDSAYFLGFILTLLGLEQGASKADLGVER
jgi:hypothetical protein